MFFSDVGNARKQEDVAFGEKFGKFLLYSPSGIGIGLDIAKTFERFDLINASGQFEYLLNVTKAAIDSDVVGAAGLGETIGGLTIYMTGYGGGTVFANANHGRIQAAYSRLLKWVERRGSLTLFVLSAVLNPFFYPAALAAGALRFGVQRYFLICWAGKIIKGITVAYAGYWGLRSLLRMLGMPV